MTAEDLDALAADVGKKNAEHDGCDVDCEGFQLLQLARGYLSLRLVQADHERQIAALQAAYDDAQAAYLRVCMEKDIIEGSPRPGDVKVSIPNIVYPDGSTFVGYTKGKT